jgi:short-subunit dehydrogenase
MSYALITGGSKGIGKAIAEALARLHFNILIIARSEELLKKEAERLAQKYSVSADYLAIDLSSPDAALNIFEWCRVKKYTVFALVNNAGYGLSGPFEKYTAEDHLNMLQVNVATPVLLCRFFLPMLRMQSRSYILNIASTAAYQAVPYLNVYAASKSFIRSFSRGLRQELRDSKVSVTCVSPGATETEFPTRAMIGEKGLKTADRVNMTPESVANIAVKSMLAGKAEVITGTINKIGAFFVWLLPKGLVERTAMKIYK